MVHCPECRRPFASQHEICPGCWEHLVPGAPPREGRLRLVYTASAWYEAEMIEALLANEGIPCLKVLGSGAGLLPVVVPVSMGTTRLYVHRDMAPAALDLITEITGSAVADT